MTDYRYESFDFRHLTKGERKIITHIVSVFRAEYQDALPLKVALKAS